MDAAEVVERSTEQALGILEEALREVDA